MSDEKDLENLNWKHDHLHPIKLHHHYLDSVLNPIFVPKLQKVTSREQGRHPEQNYGNYIFIGQKK